MDVRTFSETRANLKQIMDRVVEDRVPVIITRRKAEPVVMDALSEWRAMDETTHLLSSPANAAALRASIAEFKAEHGEERELHRLDYRIVASGADQRLGIAQCRYHY